jgi:GMP synthase (glutamine-hydrolysing)
MCLDWYGPGMASRPLRAVVVQHVLFEGLGLLGPMLTERGYTIDRIEAGIDPVDRAADGDLLVVLGGPIGVNDAELYPFVDDEIAVIRRAVDAGVPVLGICLGAQLIAAALGAPVTASGRLELGYAPIALVDGGADSALAPLDGQPVLHWHGDEFGIPDGAVRLARSDAFENQAFAVGDRVLALQFHLETDPAALERWLIGNTQELAHHGIDPRDLRADAQRVGQQLSRDARAVFASWLDRLPTA